ncbi:MAG: DUF1844 domain-containing protein [Acidobacteriota bacterium]|nr:DUF1844 domain-containing protein [Acidobacteriota bacterium]
MSDVENTIPEEAAQDLQTDANDRNDEEEFDIPLPPASFEFLVISLRAQAEMQMGLMHFGPEDRRPKPNFEIARHSIDLLDCLHEKTKGNLSLEEKRLIENTLTELRFRYVQAVKDGSPKETPK